MGEVDFQRETLSMLADIRERIAGIESGNAERCKARLETITALKDAHDDHEERLRKLEEHKALTKGQATALAAMGTAVGVAAGALAPMLVKGN